MKPTSHALKILAAALLSVPAGARLSYAAHLNPAFLEYNASVSSAAFRAKAAAPAAAPRHYFGFRPSPIDMSGLAGKDVSGLISKKAGFTAQAAPATYAAAYDLRDYGKLTAIRDQGTCGDCWAFATYGSMESNLLPGETWDFSEAHLDTTNGFDWGSCGGGISSISAAYLSRWSGPTNEGQSSPVRKHMQEMLWLPPANPGGNDAAFINNVKAAITTHGAVYSSLYWDENATNNNDTYYYNSRCTQPYGTDGACTCSGAASSCGGHAIALVGWNDNYAKSNFTTTAMGTPAGNGAFIARNSWGVTGSNDGGYFYISYYDKSLGGDNAVFNVNEAVTNYTRVYDYDPLGDTLHIGNTDVTGVDSTMEWMSNIFTAAMPGYIRAAGFYTTDISVLYSLYVYTGVTAGSPVSGTLAYSASGSIPLPGYHTITIPTDVAVALNQKFSIVVKLTNSSDLNPIAIEMPYSDYSSAASASPGQSYVSHNGTSWTDVTTVAKSVSWEDFTNTNVCLKAYSNTDSTPPTTIAAVYDGNTPGTDISKTGSTTQLSANWTASSDPETGVTEYRYAIGSASGDTSVTGGWVSNGTVQSVTRSNISPPLTGGTTYYFGVKAVNSVGMESAETWSNGQLVDTSLPSDVPYVFDGKSTDIDYVPSKTALSANWGESTYPTGIDHYAYAIGTTRGGTDVVNWYSTGTARNVTRTGLSLNEGTTYYFSVVAYNSGLHASAPVNSDGQTVDVTSPAAKVTITSGLPAVSSITLSVDVLVTEANRVYSSSPSLSFTTSGGGQTVPLALQAVTGSTWTFSGHVETWYSTGTATLHFSATDMAGNKGTVISAGGTGAAFSINTAVSGAAGGSVSNSDGMAVTVPAGAYSGSLYVRISTVSSSVTSTADNDTTTSLRPLSVDLSRVFNAYDSNGAPVTSFSTPLNITMAYPDADNDGRIDGDYLSETQAYIYYLDPVLGKWTPVPNWVRDTVANTITVPVSHFSVYSIRVLDEEQTTLAPKAYPNPCDFKKHPLTISGIPLDAAGVKVYIYNPAAELVRTLSSGDGIDPLNKVTWDGKLKNGSKAASGLYLYLVKTKGSGKGGGKFFGVW